MTDRKVADMLDAQNGLLIELGGRKSAFLLLTQSRTYRLTVVPGKGGPDVVEHSSCPTTDVLPLFADLPPEPLSQIWERQSGLQRFMERVIAADVLFVTVPEGKTFVWPFRQIPSTEDKVQIHQDPGWPTWSAGERFPRHLLAGRRARFLVGPDDFVIARMDRERPTFHGPPQIEWEEHRIQNKPKRPERRTASSKPKKRGTR